jgi:hypothetical protein
MISSAFFWTWGKRMFLLMFKKDEDDFANIFAVHVNSLIAM